MTYFIAYSPVVFPVCSRNPLAEGVANPFHIAKVDPAKIIEFSFTDLMNSGGITLIFRGPGSRLLVAELKVKGLLPVHEGGRS